MKPKRPVFKPKKGARPPLKFRDPTWRVRMALSKKVVPSGKVYRRKPKHPKEGS